MLTPEDRIVLDIASRFYRWPASREAAMRVELGLSPTRYAQRLNGLIDDPEALGYAPVVVNRLRRQRATALRARSLRAG